MSLLSDVVGIAHSVTLGLGFQPLVTLRQKGTPDGVGRHTPTVSSVRALIEYKTRQVRSQSGDMVTVNCTVTFLDATVQPAAGDTLVLPDGKSGEVVAIDGAIVDPETGQPILNQAFLE